MKNTPTSLKQDTRTPQPQPGLMKAITLSDFGAPFTPQAVPVPRVVGNEIRIRVKNAGVNGIDVMVASGYLKGMMEHRFPAVLGREFSGVVEAIGPEASKIRVGDEVIGVVPLPPAVEKGAWSEYVAVPETGILAAKPRQATWEQAAALPWAATTAVQSVDALKLRKKDKILIVGATGGVGNYALQLATKAGAFVIATAKATEEAFVRRLGVHQTVDYTKGSVAEWLGKTHPDGVDAILDLANQAPALSDLTQHLRKGGRAASTVGGLNVEELAKRAITATNVMMNPNAADLARIAHAYDAQGLHVPVQRVFPLDQIEQAVQAFRAGTLGKVLLSMEAGQ